MCYSEREVKVIQMQNFPKSQNLHVIVLNYACLKIVKLTCHENREADDVKIEILYYNVDLTCQKHNPEQS